MTNLRLVLLITLPSLIIIFLVFLLIGLYIKRRKQKVYNKVFDEIRSAMGSKVIQMYYKNDSNYDIYVETQYTKYFIRVLTDTKNKKLKIDSNFNYFYEDKNGEKNITEQIGITTVMFNQIDVNKRVNKVIILYPDVIQKIFYKSNVEARFIYQDFELQGCHILNFSEVKKFFSNVEV